ncbi:signal peptidase complex-like protein DTM1 [Zingiber officinale]|uniref:signal peptidase complex-like protein DTM1 n=1 Tax=Zingiber officinale TaxID=94328 RepID=UPI001C4D6C3F|nr:signal peptidase complex-like protein DTM1 [Zingiber officinale]
MRREAALQASLLALAAVMVLVGIWTFSLKKMLGTYAFGIMGIAGILLPDWEYFDRDFSQWFTPMPARRTPGVATAHDTFRFKFHPLRVTIISLIYGFGLYKWWKFLSN